MAASCAVMISLGGAAQQTMRLTDMDLSALWQEYGKVGKGRSVTGMPATVKGVAYDDVIGTHARSVMKIDLHGDAVRLRAKGAVADHETGSRDAVLTVVPLVDGTKMCFRQSDDGAKQFAGYAGADSRIGKGSVVFAVKGDGRTLFESGVVRGGSKPVDIDVDLTGVRVLELSVDPTADGASGDHALWIAPAIEYRSEKPSTLDAGYSGEGPEMPAATARLLAEKIGQLPVYDEPLSTRTAFDWLLTPEKAKGGIYRSPDGKSIIVANQMVARVMRVFPNLATTNIVNRMTGESMLRAVSSEGSVTIDGEKHQIGGLDGQPERAYLLDRWIDDMTTVPGAFIVEDFTTAPVGETLPWARSRWALNKEALSGQEVVFTLRGEKELSDVRVRLHVAVYDRIPVICKWFEVVNGSRFPINIDSFQVEYLAFAEPESPVGGDPSTFLLPNIHVESDYACAGAFTEKETDITEKWVPDPAYTS